MRRGRSISSGNGGVSSESSDADLKRGGIKHCCGEGPHFQESTAMVVLAGNPREQCYCYLAMRTGGFVWEKGPVKRYYGPNLYVYMGVDTVTLAPACGLLRFPCYTAEDRVVGNATGRLSHPRPSPPQAARCWWCRYQNQTREHLFKVCPEWKTQQKILWAEVRKETGRWNDR